MVLGRQDFRAELIRGNVATQPCLTCKERSCKSDYGKYYPVAKLVQLVTSTKLRLKSSRTSPKELRQA